MEKKKQKDCRAPRSSKNEDMVGAPPRNETNWLDWEEASKV